MFATAGALLYIRSKVSALKIIEGIKQKMHSVARMWSTSFAKISCVSQLAIRLKLVVTRICLRGKINPVVLYP